MYLDFVTTPSSGGRNRNRAVVDLLRTSGGQPSTRFAVKRREDRPENEPTTPANAPDRKESRKVKGGLCGC